MCNPPLRSLRLFLPILAGVCSIAQSAPAVHALDTLRVRAGRPRAADRSVDVAREEDLLGIQDDLNTLLFLQPGVSRLPEAGSALLVRGGGPYDNLFTVWGVTLFAPSHYAQHSYADRSGPFITSVDMVRIEMERVAGRYRNAPGAAVSMHPGITRHSDARLKPRPELTVNYGTLATELSLSVPLRRARSMYELGVRKSNDYLMNVMGQSNMYMSYGSAGTPVGYGDLLLNGENNLGPVRLEQHLWLAYDSYDNEERPQIPWGVAAASAHRQGRWCNWDLAVGGSRQHWIESQILGPLQTASHTVRSNTAATFTIHPPASETFDWSLQLKGEYLAWSDTLTTAWQWYGRPSGERSSVVAGQEAYAEIQASAQRKRGAMTLGADMLGGGLFPQFRGYLDPGLWMWFSGRRLVLELAAGTHSAQPDIRGGPDSLYRSFGSRIYGLSSTLRLAQSGPLQARSGLFANYRDRCPARSVLPENPRWDPALETGLLSCGANLQLDWTPLDWLGTRSVVDLWYSRRHSGAALLPYEYDMPWTLKGVLRLGRQGGHMLHLTGVWSAGLPYRELLLEDGALSYDKSWRRMPDYKRIDIRYEIQHRNIKHRWLTLYGGYVGIDNLICMASSMFSSDGRGQWVNHREYYWHLSPDGSQLVRFPVDLMHWTMRIGIRVGLRL